ncbi:tetratricopeptide repeat protein [Nocardia amamiensis]|uniref:Tetratricopeptide repeat protein n=1 Tax=Nocardia amamiensis TaxID=404578 RepID=A0ABS0D690_9NOCA|nr:tetratricopeptide repeat protein [Nocardia amamiensis]MBF6302638.1 tetratricopeptide repeat protein [Nocardia amamiensis]
MSADTERTEVDEPIGTPRSSLWQGFLGTASVVAYTVLFELVRTLVVNSFGENALVQFLNGTLRWLSVLVIGSAATYALYRFAAGYRLRVRTAREMDLIAGLVEPGPALADCVPRRYPRAPRRVSALDDDPVASVLRDLPVREFESVALLAVLNAIRDTEGRLPLAREPSAPTAAMQLADLRRRGILAEHGAQRFQVRQVPIRPNRATVTAEPEWGAAVTALLHHYADRAERWAIALESRRFAGGARRWFEAEERYLCALVAACANAGVRFPAAALAHLARLGDALDVWHARIGLDDERGVAAALSSLQGLDELNHDLVRLRAGGLTQPPRRYRPLRLSTSLAARWEHREALKGFGAVPLDLDGVADQLETAWWLLPRDDVAGEVCALINLAVVHIRQGRLDAAGDRLELAESLTRTGRDPDGRAQTHETFGVLWWARGEPRRALRCWQRALTAFRVLDDDPGIGRCLQHLGSAIVVAPDHATLLLPTDPPLTRTEALRQATGWLAEARRRHPAARHAEQYAVQAHSALRVGRGSRDLHPSSRRTPLTSIDLWPAALEDQI